MPPAREASVDALAFRFFAGPCYHAPMAILILALLVLAMIAAVCVAVLGAAWLAATLSSLVALSAALGRRRPPPATRG